MAAKAIYYSDLQLTNKYKLNFMSFGMQVKHCENANESPVSHIQ